MLWPVTARIGEFSFRHRWLVLVTWLVILGGGRVVKVEEPVYGGANGALKIAHDMPAEYWERLK